LCIEEEELPVDLKNAKRLLKAVEESATEEQQLRRVKRWGSDTERSRRGAHVSRDQAS